MTIATGPSSPASVAASAGALTARRIADEHVADLLARRAHIQEHRERDLGIAEPRLPVDAEGNDEQRHG